MTYMRKLGLSVEACEDTGAAENLVVRCVYILLSHFLRAVQKASKQSDK